MIAQLQPDARIPPQVYELASSHGVGTPLKRHKRKSIQIVLVIGLLALLFLVGWFCYNIYGYIAFIILSRTYPNINDVPPDRLDNYLWLQVIHDNFGTDMLQISAPLLAIVGRVFPFYPAYRTKLYICTDGLLKVYKKKDQAIRWDEVKELYTTNGNVTKLVKQDGSSFELPSLLMSGSGKTISTLISDEVTRCLLPGMLASYERGETVWFGNLEVNQKGIYRLGGLVSWDRLGDIALEKGQLSAYYSEPGQARMENGQISTKYTAKWHTWRESALTSKPWPNLPVFVALVNHILDQRGADRVQETPVPQQPLGRKEAAAIARRRDRKRKRVKIAALVIAILCILSILISIPVYQGIEEQARVDHDLQLIRSYIKMLAHKPYYARVPGQHCDHGKGFWSDDDTNVFICQKDGLLMTQKNMKYQDETYFSFDPDAPGQTTFTGVYIPHHYRVQVKATIVSGGPSTCVSLHVHVQDFQGRQGFAVCADGSWIYSRCDLQCNTDKLVAAGNLPYAKNSYLIAVDVTDNDLTLIVDNKEIASETDNTYSSTDEIVLALFGDQNAGKPISALFSDFLYTPYL